MGTCKFCKTPAGFFKSEHQACKQRFNDAKEKIGLLIHSSFTHNLVVDDFQRSIRDIQFVSRFNEEIFKQIIVAAWEEAVELAFDDKILSDEEEENLIIFKEILSLSQEELDRNGVYTRLVKGSVIRDVINGIIPQRLKINGVLPFNLKRGEQILWVFPDGKYLEEKILSKRVGGSKGVSVRVCKGVYYRVGAFKSHSIQYKDTITYQGCIGITDKHLYFSGVDKSFRIRLDKIVSLEPYLDGISIYQEKANARRQTFVTGDGWFAYNLVANLGKE